MNERYINGTLSVCVYCLSSATIYVAMLCKTSRKVSCCIKNESPPGFKTNVWMKDWAGSSSV